MSDLDETQMRKSSQLCPPYLNTNSYLSQKLEDFIHVTDPNHHNHKVDVADERRILLSKEELDLEREIIRLIHTGNSETLKPNSLQSVVVNEHHICVACREDTDPEYRVWEWHGHIMFNDPENGFTTEYVYGNYFEKRLMKELADEDEQYYEEEEKEEDGLLNLGLRDLIGGGNSINDRIIQLRNMKLSAGSSRQCAECGCRIVFCFDTNGMNIPKETHKKISSSMMNPHVDMLKIECSEEPVTRCMKWHLHCLFVPASGKAS